MTRTQAEQLRDLIHREDERCEVTSYRQEGDVTSLDVVDTRTGIPFVIHNLQEWSDRLDAARAMAAAFDDVDAAAEARQFGTAYAGPYR